MGKVLVVDDEVSVRGVMSDFLKHFGHKSVMAEDGVTALGLVGRERPDLVILDFFLPDMVALQFLSQLKRGHPDLPVIMITSFWNRMHVQVAMKDPWCDYVPKPIDFVQLLETIDHRLAQAANS